MSDRESGNLLFHPGLSTAEHISNVSGRGVGMDVKTTLRKLAEPWTLLPFPVCVQLCA
jgi:two-component system chemotaxis sensor kinase CheA